MYTEGDAAARDKNSHRRHLMTRLARVDEALRRWDAWDAWTAAHRPDARVGRRGGGANHVRHQGAPPALPPLTRQALTELRTVLLEELECREQELANGDDSAS